MEKGVFENTNYSQNPYTTFDRTNVNREVLPKNSDISIDSVRVIRMPSPKEVDPFDKPARRNVSSGTGVFREKKHI